MVTRERLKINKCEGVEEVVVTDEYCKNLVDSAEATNDLATFRAHIICLDEPLEEWEDRNIEK